MTCINKPICMDYETHILNNCEFFSDGQVRTIISKDKSNEFRAYVTRSTGDTRGVLLTSDGADTAHGALESLFHKSAEATGHYITNSGFAFPPDTENLGIDSDDDDDAVSVSSSSCASDVDTSDDEDHAVTPPTSHGSARPSSFPASFNAKSRKSVSKSGKSRGPRMSLMGNGSIEVQPVPPKPFPMPRGTHPGSVTQPPVPRWSGNIPPPPPPMSHGPMNPARGPTGPLQQPHSRPNNQMLSAAGAQPPYPPPPPGFRSGPPPRPAPVLPTGPSVRLYDVRLTLRGAIPGGEQRLLDSSRPSIRALQDLAISHVQSISPPFERPGLRATVRQAFFGDEAYDMTAYRGDDLTKLFNVLSVSSIPSFEIDIEVVPALPPIPPNRPNPGNNVMGPIQP